MKTTLVVEERGGETKKMQKCTQKKENLSRILSKIVDHILLL